MYKILKKYLMIVSVLGLLIFLLKPRPTTNQKEYAIVDHHVTLAGECNMDSLLWLYEYYSYNEDSMGIYEEQGALCGKLYFEIAFLKRFKTYSFDRKNRIITSLTEEKVHIEQAKILLKKIEKID